VAEQLLCRHSGFLEPFRPRPIDQPIGATTPPLPSSATSDHKALRRPA
jgi:hypothetical protein